MEIDDIFGGTQSSDAENDSDDVTVATASHKKLLSRLGVKAKSRRAKTVRGETSANVSEFTLGSKPEERLGVYDLMSKLGDTIKTTELKKRLRTVAKKNKKLDKPLEKMYQDKASRQVAYAGVVKEVSKWDDTVRINREADQLTFPLKKPDLRLIMGNEFVEKFKPQTVLEQQIADALKSSRHVIDEERPISEAEEAILSAMDLEEALRKRSELMMLRARQSYQEAKFKRHKKIKSKSFHRIQKKERKKQEEKKTADALESNPELLDEKLEEAEKERATERASLRHRGAGKWAKFQQLRAKTDPQSREALAEQLRISREKTKKQAIFDEASDSDSKADEAGTNDDGVDIEVDGSNPWMCRRKDGKGDVGLKDAWADLKSKMATTDKENADGAKKKHGGRKPDGKKLKTKKAISVESDHDDDNPMTTETRVMKRTLADYDRMDDVPDLAPRNRKERRLELPSSKPTAAPENVTQNIDPDKFISVHTTTLQSAAESAPGDDDALVDDDQPTTAEHTRRLTIAEAFAEDDVIAEFRDEKDSVAERDRPKEVDLTLPGWGEWSGGKNEMSMRKRKKFVIPAAPAPPRRDAKLADVIISEKRDASIKPFMVSELPYPFQSVSDFEASVRMPLGPTWNPETAVRKMTAPRVLTRMGRIIEPMTDEEMIKKDRIAGGKRGEKRAGKISGRAGRGESSDPKGKALKWIL